MWSYKQCARNNQLVDNVLVMSATVNDLVNLEREIGGYANHYKLSRSISAMRTKLDNARRATADSLNQMRNNSASQPEGDSTMSQVRHKSNTIFLVNDKVLAVRVAWDPENNPGDCSIVKTFDNTLKLKDIVNVECESRVGVSTAQVVALDVEVDFASNSKTNWILGLVDIERFKELQAQEDDMLAKVRKAQLAKTRKTLAKDLMDDAADSIATLPIAHRTHENDQAAALEASVSPPPPTAEA